MRKREYIMVRVSKESKDLIKKAAEKNNTTVSKLVIKGLSKVVPELEDIIWR